MESHTYRTIAKPSQEVLFKDRNSKFFGYAFPVANEAVIKSNLESLKKRHPKANHWCYAYQLGTQVPHFRSRANDDGEPNNCAGMPIYGQIQSFEVTNIMIVVVRYFGGVKLGVSGLVHAYRTTAQMALEASEIVSIAITKSVLVTFDYLNINTVMRIIREKNLTVKCQKLEMSCEITVLVAIGQISSVLESFGSHLEISTRVLND